MRTHEFGKDFFFGTATASYQVEGTKYGRIAPSIWDSFSKVPGKVYMAQDGYRACEHYERYEEDILLMKELGFKSYRFSVSWPRIFPEKGGAPNEEALEHYRAVCRFLHENGMTSSVTIYHWDLPEYLEGGWTNRETAFEFARYAKTLYEELGDLVDMWITLNEPFCSAILGYYSGVHAPGHTDLGEAFCAVHHLLLVHALALAGYRETGLTAPIGITLNLAPGCAATESEKDREANAIFLALHSKIFTMPLFEGRYPKILEQFGIPFPVEDGDMELISRKMDFIGINFYDQGPIEWSDEDRLHFACAPFWEEKTDMGWPITPYYLLALLRWVNKVSRGLPIYITENGCACRDTVSSDGRVHDRERIDFFKDYLEATEEAIREGIPVKGYYVWSFMDNYEWSFGYSKRFGIVYVDYDTEERIAKDSAYFFRDINAGFRYW